MMLYPAGSSGNPTILLAAPMRVDSPHPMAPSAVVLERKADIWAQLELLLRSLKNVKTTSVLPIANPVRLKYCPALTLSQSLICEACKVIRSPVCSSVAIRIFTVCMVALNIGKVQMVASTITPQLPAPPPCKAQNTIIEGGNKVPHQAPDTKTYNWGERLN